MHTYIHICVCISDALLQKLPRPSSSWWGVKPLGSLGPGWAGNFSFPGTGQSQHITKSCCWFLLSGSITGLSFTLHTKIILHSASYFLEL